MSERFLSNLSKKLWGHRELWDIWTGLFYHLHLKPQPESSIIKPGIALALDLHAHTRYPLFSVDAALPKRPSQGLLEAFQSSLLQDHSAMTSLIQETWHHVGKGETVQKFLMQYYWVAQGKTTQRKYFPPKKPCSMGWWKYNTRLLKFPFLRV